MSHAVNWFTIQGPNGHALQEFYKQVFGWAMKPLPGGDMLMVPAEKDGIAGGIGTSMNHQPSVSVYVSVGDIDAVFGKIQRGGGRMAMPKTELPGGMGSIAGFTDPAGNWVGLWMPGKAAAPKRSAAPKKKAGGAKASAKSAKSVKSAKKTSGAKSTAKKTGGAKSPAKKK